MTKKQSLTRSDLVDAVYEQVSVTRSEATLLVDTVLETILQLLEDGRDVRIARFGQFLLRDKKERIGRNPKTGVEVQIPARRVVVFRPSPTLAKRMVTDAADAA